MIAESGVGTRREPKRSEPCSTVSWRKPNRSAVRRRRSASTDASSKPSSRPALGSIRLDKLSSLDLDHLYPRLTKKGNKATSVRRVHALIGAALHQGEKWGLVDNNVSRKASPPASPCASNGSRPTLTMFAGSSKPPKLSNRPFRRCSFSPHSPESAHGHCVRARWSDLDAEAGTLTIARSVYETKGGGWQEKSTKTHTERKIGLDDPHSRFCVGIVRRSTISQHDAGREGWRRTRSCSPGRRRDSNRSDPSC